MLQVWHCQLEQAESPKPVPVLMHLANFVIKKCCRKFRAFIEGSSMGRIRKAFKDNAAAHMAANPGSHIDVTKERNT